MFHKNKLKKTGRNKHSNLFVRSIRTKKKSFITLGPGLKVIKLFLTVIYQFS